MEKEMTQRGKTLPWTRSCFVCGEDNPNGLRLRSRLEDGIVAIDYTTREADRGWRHLVHGGIVITLLDEVMTWAAIIEARSACVSAEISTRLRKPVTVGQKLRIEGKTAGGRARLILTEARVLDDSGTVLSTATGKYLPMPAENLALCEKDFVLGGDSIPPSEIFG